MPKEFYITEDNSGRRIDRLLRTMWPQVPLGMIMRSLRKGGVRLDAKKVSSDTRVETGQFLQVPWDDNTVGEKKVSAIHEYTDSKLNTIYRDDYVWMLNKKAGLLTQPDVKNGDSLITRALSELRWGRTDFCPSAVQRLDRNTSGIVLVALCGQAQRLLTELIRERRIRKIYRVVIDGSVPESGEINLPLLKDNETNIVHVSENGQPSITRYHRISGGAGFSCVEAELITGRSHQIRVHFASIGHAVIGDRKYGSDTRGTKRPLLHAYSVSFPDDKRLPESLRAKSFTADMPDDIKKYFTE